MRSIIYFILIIQIANVLEGKLTFDGDALQTLVNFESKYKKDETNTDDTNEQS